MLREKFLCFDLDSLEQHEAIVTHMEQTSPVNCLDPLTCVIAVFNKQGVEYEPVHRLQQYWMRTA